MGKVCGECGKTVDDTIFLQLGEKKRELCEKCFVDVWKDAGPNRAQRRTEIKRLLKQARKEQRVASWYPMRRQQAENVIKRLEKRYNVDEMRTIIQSQLLLSRSPGKRDVYTEWLEAHTQPQVNVRIAVEDHVSAKLEEISIALKPLEEVG